ncbi:3-hydroxyacyl-CoA dehydrogenase [Rhodococcus sp. 14-2686-1-2]|nr:MULTISPECIES: 3-hydroxyacyl-CoA dehydrogenase family protein [unclassified Rhodococcus (in: high G+C Gram-positive bacteria)]OZE90753.1 3-hydroxyacyl-CoA dehydrogenase [Rhodococcus sp. 15-1189-1-1a]OZF07728.1 3-hydroxyacyl-CoA dehydrogenase [Rhodococcus sp. 14-2686-1-2]
MDSFTLNETTVGVVGAGMMGSGIAYACARAGAVVIIVARSREKAEIGKSYAQEREHRALARNRGTADTSAELLRRIVPSSNISELAAADIVIEAVAESVDIKQQILRDIERVVASKTIVASTTSTLPITTLAAGLARPGNAIGMHFFSPVERMRLLEVVMGEQTESSALDSTLRFAERLGKVPIVVRDTRGFFTSRVMDCYLDEALMAVGEGVRPEMIEKAARNAGYPVSPLQLLDEISLTLNTAVRRETRVAVEAAALRWTGQRADAVRNRMVDDYRRGGRNSGGGFYDYDSSGSRTGLWPGLREAFGPTRTIPIEDMSDRLLFIQALEALQCLDEGVVRSAADADTGSVLGIGFPAQTGGAINFVERFPGGRTAFVNRARTLTERYGERFSPPGTLDEGI